MKDRIGRNHVQWNKGKPCTYGEKISRALKGKHTSPKTEFKMGHIIGWKHGLANDKEHKRKLYLERKKNWSEEYKEKCRERNRLWIKNNPLYVKTRNHNRKLKMRGLTIKMVQMVYEDNIKKYGTLTCYLCEKPINFGKDHLEHRIPLSRGGDNNLNNLAISCNICNQHKYNKTEEEYLAVWEHAK